jgi:hypothetical protein
MEQPNPVSSSTARKVPDRFLVAFSLAGEQRELVRAIAEAVEAKLGSSNVFYYEWYEHYISGDDADLRLQKIYREQCVLAVVCVSSRYGDKPWTQAEHAAIRSRAMRARESKDQSERLAVLPIRVGDGDVEGILFNAIVPDVRGRTADESAELIIKRLGLIAPPADPAPHQCSWPEVPTPLEWPMADHGPVRDAFVVLLRNDAPYRFLPILGPSETGKSHITKQILGIALGIAELACGRFDFKGTTDMDAEVRTFVQDLDVSLPPASAKLNERLGHILKEIRQRHRPTLLVFDTYEAAGEAADWVENQLLTRAVRDPYLRVVVAGQQVPRLARAVWGRMAREPILLKPPQAAEWFMFGKIHRKELTLSDVEVAFRLSGNRPSLLAQLLGPVA